MDDVLGRVQFGLRGSRGRLPAWFAQYSTRHVLELWKAERLCPVEAPLRRLRDVVKRLRLAADQREVILRHAEERGCLATGRLLAVPAMTDRDEGGIGLELELDRAACALGRMFLRHVITFSFNGWCRLVKGDSRYRNQ